MEPINFAPIEGKSGVLTADELKKAMDEMVRVQKEQGSALAKLGNANYVAKQLFEMSQRGQVYKYYKSGVFVGLMAFDVAFLWWLDKPLLIEQLVLSCDKDARGVQREALKTLDYLAKEVFPQVAGIASGCLFLKQPQIVMNAYKKNGYTQAAPTALKILNVARVGSGG